MASSPSCGVASYLRTGFVTHHIVAMQHFRLSSSGWQDNIERSNRMHQVYEGDKDWLAHCLQRALVFECF